MTERFDLKPPFEPEHDNWPWPGTSNRVEKSLARIFRNLYIVPKNYTLYKNLLSKHFRGHLAGGEKVVYCPVGRITSHHPGDYDNEWCHYCQKYFNEVDNE